MLCDASRDFAKPSLEILPRNALYSANKISTNPRPAMRPPHPEVPSCKGRFRVFSSRAPAGHHDSDGISKLLCSKRFFSSPEIRKICSGLFLKLFSVSFACDDSDEYVGVVRTWVKITQKWFKKIKSISKLLHSKRQNAFARLCFLRPEVAF